MSTSITAASGAVATVAGAARTGERTADGTHRLPFKLSQKLPTDECYLETECPRGQMGFYIVGDGNAEPLRARAKSSCFCNLSVAPPISVGCLLGDIPAIVGSLDVVMGEIDR